MNRIIAFLSILFLVFLIPDIGMSKGSPPPPPPQLTISPSTKDVFYVNQNIKFTASGGTTPYRFSANIGSIDGSGNYRAPASAGNASIKVTDNKGNTATYNVPVYFNISINPPSSSVPTNSNYSFSGSGGTGGYKYSTNNGSIGSTNGVFSASGSPGSAVITVTDSRNNRATSNVSIYQSLGITPTSNLIMVGRTFTFRGTGGYGSYSYSTTNGSIASNGVFTAPGSAGSATITVTDSRGAKATAAVTIYPTLAISPTSKILAVNGSTTFTSSGGYGTRTFSRTQGAGTVGSSNGIFVAPAVAGSAVVTVTDSLGNTAAANITINSELSISPTSKNLAINGTFNFSGSGGVAPLSFSSTYGSIGSSSGAYTAPGAGGLGTITVTDSSSPKLSKTASVCVFAPLTIFPSTKTITIGNTISFSASEGCKPYTFSVTNAIGSINSSTGLYTGPNTPPAAGTKAIIRVTDAAGNTTDANITISSNLALEPPPLTLPINGTYDLKPSGGVPPYIFAVTNGVGSINSNGKYTAPGIEGTANISVTDGDGIKRTGTICVYEPLQIVPKTKAFIVGDTFTFTAVHGCKPYVFSKNIGTINSGSGAYTASSVGLEEVSVTDLANKKSTASVSIYPPLTLNPLLAKIQIGKIINFIAKGGIPDFSWEALLGKITPSAGSINPLSVEGVTNITTTAVFTAPNTKGQVSVIIKDSAGHNQTAYIDVYEPLAISPLDKILAPNDSFSFTANGGVPPYTFSKDIVGGGIVTNGAVGLFTAPANQTVGKVKVIDSAVPPNEAIANVTVNAPLSINPTTANLEVNKSLPFVASGGLGPYTFSSSFEGTRAFDGNGNFRPIKSGIVTITLKDSAGHEVFATVNVYDPLEIIPNDKVLAVGDSFDRFTARGGIPGYSFNQSIGLVDPISGIYTAPLGAPGTGFVELKDSIGNSTKAQITINPGLSLGPETANVEVGKTSKFTGSGGIGDLTFSASGGTIDSNGNYTAPLSAGPATITLTDKAGHSKSVTINIYNPLNISPQQKVLVLGGGFQFNISGGVLPYKNVALKGDIDITGFYTSKAAGADTITVTDSIGNTVTASVTVNAVLSVTPITANLEVNKVLPFVVSGGIGPYTYRSSMDMRDFDLNGNFRPIKSGTATLTFTDSTGKFVTAVVKVYDPLNISPTSKDLAVGNKLPFLITGGLTPYKKIKADRGVMDQFGNYTAPSEVGDGKDIVTVIDQDDNTVTANLNIKAALGIDPSSATLAVNRSINFQGIQGVPPYTYTVKDFIGSVDFFTGSYRAPASSGTAEVTVRDSIGNTAKATVTINPDLDINPKDINLAVGKTRSFSASGGVGDLRFSALRGQIDPISGAYTAPQTVGEDTITVTDGGGFTKTAKVNVYDTLKITPANIDLAVNDKFKFTISGGIFNNKDKMVHVLAGRGTIDESGNYTAPSEVGNGEDLVTVKDSDGNIVTARVTINSPLSITPALANLEIKKTLNFTVSGGVGNLTLSKDLGSITQAGLFTAPSSVGSGLATITVTDEGGHLATAKVNIYDTLKISPAQNELAVNDPFKFTITGGFSTLTVSASRGVIDKDGNYTAPSDVGDGEDTITVKDSDNNVVTAKVFINSALSISPSTANLEVSKKLDFTVSGGIGPFNYVSSIGSISSDRSTKNTTGKYTAPVTKGTATITVTDNLGHKITAVVNVYEPLKISPTNKVLALGNKFDFTASGGFGVYTFGFETKIGDIITNGNKGSYTAPSDDAGTGVITLTDSIGNVVKANIGINTSLAVRAPASLPINEDLNFKSITTGGIPDYSFSTTLGTIDSNGNYKAPASGGMAEITVTDSDNVTKTVSVCIFAPLTISPPSKILAAKDTETFEAKEGCKPYKFEVTGGIFDFVEGATSGLFKAPDSSGSATVKVTDNVGHTVSASIDIKAALSISPSTGNLQVKKPLSFSASGGVGTRTFSALRGQIDSASGAYTAPETPGEDTITVTDTANHSDSAKINVYPSLKISPIQKDLAIGDSVEFIIEGGLAPYVSIDAKNGSIDANRKYTAAVEGGGSVIVEDSAGNKATANITITSALSLDPLTADVEVLKLKQFSASGGVGELTFSTVVGRGSIDVNGKYTAPASVGADTVTVRDTAGHSLTAAINVYQSLKITPTQKTLAVGDEIDFVIEGGFGQLTIVPAGGSIDENRKYIAITVGSGSVIVTDSVGNSVTANLTINPALTLDPTLANVEVGKTKQFSASGGVGDLIFSTVVGRGSIDLTGKYTAPASVGADTVTVSDTAGHSLTAAINVYESLRITPTPKDLAVGNSFKFIIAGGFTPYLNVSSARGASIDSNGNYTAPSDVGNGEDTITVTDSDNNTVTAKVNIKPALRIDPSAANLAVNRPKTFIGLDGVGPYTFTVNGIGSVGLTSGSFSATSPGTSEVIVTDSLGNTAKAAVTINPELLIDPENINLAVNGIKKFNATGGVGTPIFSIITGTGNIGSDGTFTAPATKGLVQIKVTDSEGFSKTANINVYLPLNIDPTEKILAVGNNWNFKAIEGVPPYVFSVDSSIGSITTSDLTNINVGKASLTAAGATLPAVGYITLRDTANPDNEVKAKVTVNAPLSIDPKPSFLAAGGTYDFKASTKGGAPDFTYTVTKGSGSFNNGIYTAPSSGEEVAEITVTDSMGASQKASFCVYGQIQFDPDQDKTLALGNQYTFVAKGGCKPYAFTNTIGTLANSTTGAFTASPNTGSGIIKVTDASNANSAQINVTINPALSLSPSLANIEVGKTKDFTATGGVLNYNFILATPTGKGALNSSTGPTVTFTAPAASGSNTIRVTDSFGNIKEAAVTIYSSLAITPAAKQNIEVGKPALPFSATGGVPPYVFTLGGGVGSISSAESSNALYNPGTTKGTNKVILTDKENNTREVEINVYASLILSPSENQNIAKTGNVSFTASEGLPPYSWTVSPAGGNLTNTAGASTVFSAPNVTQFSTFTVTVTDSLNTSRFVTIGVVPPIAISPKTKTLAVQSNFTFTASGGSGNYVWSKTIGDINQEGIFSALNNPGTGIVTVADKLIPSLSDSADITITPKFSLVPEVASVETGKSKNDFVISGGVGPFNFSVDGTDRGTVTWTGTTLTYNAKTSANGNVAAGPSVIRGTDSLGNNAIANVTVYAGLGITPPSKTLAKNATATFMATGGTAPYTWIVDHGTLTPSGTGGINGNYTFSEFVLTANVTVKDSAGKTATAIITGDFPGSWIWASGVKETNKGGSTATEGGPGARGGSSNWADNNGNVYLQGGVGWGLGDPGANTTTIYLYYLWKYDTTLFKWTAIKQGPQYGYYGASSSAPPQMDPDDPSTSDNWTSPGGRLGATTWTDKSGLYLWLFGGQGYGVAQNNNITGSSNSAGYLNDLWRYEILTGNWTWVKGAKIINQSGAYTGGSVNPGGRVRTTRWKDSSGNLWLFGGYGYDRAGNLGYLNDVWKFTPSTTSPYGNWQFVTGSDAVNAQGNYISETAKYPGGREGATSWVTSDGQFWFFGGTGLANTSTVGLLNDLWKFNPTNNTWSYVKGRDLNGGGVYETNKAGSYGTKNTASASNIPGSRDRAVGFTDSKGNLWMFGGYGNGNTVANGFLNDLWRINTLSGSPQWVWERGADVTGASITSGNWGSIGVLADTNIPDARCAPISWQDSFGMFWFFGGGQARDEVGKKSSEVWYHNDLWKFFPE